jgi:hypothetical protein
MKPLFVELHYGDSNKPMALRIAVDGIRMIRPVAASDKRSWGTVLNEDAYLTAIIFKGDAWTTFVHETPDMVAGLCGIDISRMEDRSKP